MFRNATTLLLLAVLAIVAAGWLVLGQGADAPFKLSKTYALQRWAPGVDVDDPPLHTGEVNTASSGPGWRVWGEVDGRPFEGVGVYGEQTGEIEFSLNGPEPLGAVVVQMRHESGRLTGTWSPRNIVWNYQGDLFDPDAQGIEIWTPKE